MQTYERIMRLILLESRIESRAYKLLSRGDRAAGERFSRGLKVHSTLTTLIYRLQRDVHTLNTALRDLEESR